MLNLYMWDVTVEDKGPSVLWKLGTNEIFGLWYNLLQKQTGRWQICDYTTLYSTTSYLVIFFNVQHIQLKECSIRLLHG